MPIKTTCIGAYPKPDYVPIKDWFQVQLGLTSTSGEVTRRATRSAAQEDANDDALYQKATHAAVGDQIECGVDIPTDGEQRRENYIHYHCRHLTGFDFHDLTSRVLRDGAYEAELPTIRGKIEPDGSHFLDRDYRQAQAASDRPVKITVPGPTTIIDTCADDFYGDERALAFDLADALNFEVRALADAGCTHIQIDEPLFARNTQRALNFGVECLERCFDGLPDTVTRVMHMCCGYPGHLDDHTYHKADPQSYFRLAGPLDRSSVDQVSIEDAHRHNDLTLLERFPNTTVIFGAVAIAQSQVEPAEQIAQRLGAALEHIDRDRLIAAPDCGLAMLGRDLAMAKLTHLCLAAAAV
ncbi:MAG: 5-methyltetrahydropteroyltriglutamate--homocysteine methyltransferase [Rhodobacteraceae bacterium]|nr:5-methyltetrahydropteroyltriglutamate--homocysteine methyltransferase [Paracoccaceae bacterium]